MTSFQDQIRVALEGTPHVLLARITIALERIADIMEAAIILPEEIEEQCDHFPLDQCEDRSSLGDPDKEMLCYRCGLVFHVPWPTVEEMLEDTE